MKLIYLLLIAFSGVFLFAGCTFAEKAGAAATTPRADTGEVPYKEIIAAIPKAIALDPIAIGQVFGNVAYIILAGLGLVGVGTGAVAYQVRAYKNLREEGVPVTSVPTAVAPPTS